MSAFPVPLPGTTNTLLWADPTDPDSVPFDVQTQLRNIAALPWVEGLRVMPDVHLGKGATVGSVIAMKDAISPNAVGVDIGCGMAAVKANIHVEDLPDNLGALRSRIEAAVPVSYNGHKDSVNLRALGLPMQPFTALWDEFRHLHSGVQDRKDRATSQLGTLGSGNHFIEVCTDETDNVWLMLHSGSRNIGKELAERHVAIAKALPHNADLPDRDLAVFVADTPEMDAYWHDLRWAQDYAWRNRQVMLALVQRAFADWFGHPFLWDEAILCHHNYVQREVIDGQELLVTRKGAIRAGSGDWGLIPGSMGTGSYVVKGLGNEASFFSASHGAGRKMSRSKAKKTFTIENLMDQTAGVECRKDAGVIDEIPGAYKNLEDVIAAQADLVEVKHRLRTIVCVKG